MNTGTFRNPGSALSVREVAPNIFVQVRLNAHGRSNLDEVSEAIRSFLEVLDAYVLMRQTDFMLRIVATDIDAYERFFFEKLSKFSRIQEITSTVALSEIKSTLDLSLGDQGP